MEWLNNMNQPLGSDKDLTASSILYIISMPSQTRRFFESSNARFLYVAIKDMAFFELFNHVDLHFISQMHFHWNIGARSQDICSENISFPDFLKMVNSFLIRKISFCRKMRGEALAGCFGFAGFEEELRNVPLILDNNGLFLRIFQRVYL